MAEENPSTNPAEAESVAKLTKALEAERAAHAATKSKHREFCASVYRARGLPDNATPDALFASLGDEEARVAERTKSIQEERDAALKRAEQVAGEWNAFRIDRALSEAFTKSGMKPENLEDALAMARGLFTVDEKGRVHTKPDAPNTVPGQSAETWAFSELRTKRPHWYPPSIGGGAKTPGAGFVSRVDDSCFNPRSPNHNFTTQLAFEGRYGAKAAADARAKYRHLGGSFV